MTVSNSLQLGISATPQTNDPELVRLLQPVHDAINILSNYIDGINTSSHLSAAYDPTTTVRLSAINRLVCKANSSLGNGAPVYFSLVAGVLQATLAVATAAGSLAMGFCSTEGGVTAGNFGEFTPCMGIAKGTFTLGTKYYLQNAGGYGVAAGTINQPLGVAISTTDLIFMLGVPQ